MSRLRQTIGRIPGVRRISDAVAGPARNAALAQAGIALEMQGDFIRATGPVRPHDDPLARYSPCEVAETENPEGTVFAFGGMRLGFGLPVREFFAALADSGHIVVFIKDFRQAWYQQGLVGVTSTRDETQRFLGERFAHLPRPWRFIGNSSGGFAAIWFGSRLEADRVVAFSPQTYITRHEVARFRDPFAPEPDVDLGDPYNDLRRVREGCGTPVPTTVHFGEGNELDSRHARHIEDCAGVTVVTQSSSLHSIARVLRDTRGLDAAIFGMET